ncbi:hypothetical protein CHLRE_06g302426v5 [Chlamydomonas reinhardtii]|uniref:Uncharacterized protein n=1 Tax=Chlamydomonas reinhardtii TaxID=3055 RepID=A0A2K3DR35_CHLRE|nr:uncharacterized protein CHLRE_06g302426v5 [Chlamydomonas reinhardtii]PNW82999.1 hypothetical protein CHLRE_06g302426v5 [Chlamydomonas reinhardtii]
MSCAWVAISLSNSPVPSNNRTRSPGLKSLVQRQHEVHTCECLIRGRSSPTTLKK